MHAASESGYDVSSATRGSRDLPDTEVRSPMPRLERLPEGSRKNLLNRPTQVNETAPFVRLATPLAACRVAIVTTAGLHRRGDKPFGPGEQGYRAIPADTPATDLVQSHTSLGF